MALPPLGGTKKHHHFFNGKYEHRTISGAGHNLPQEAPRDFAEAVLSSLQADRFISKQDNEQNLIILPIRLA